MQICRTFTDVTPEIFRSEVLAVNSPAVLRGLCTAWPSVKAARISDPALAAYLEAVGSGSLLEVIEAAPEVRGEFFYGETLRSRNFQKGQMTLKAALEKLADLANEASPSSLYIQSTPADGCLPDFPAKNANLLLPNTVRPRVWIGNAVRVQTHYDLSDNIAVVVAGRRHFTLFPPDQLANLYVGPFENTLAGSPVSLADIEKPDFDRYPKLRVALAAGLTAELEPGDAIYIPYGWWHHVRSLSALNMLVNYWWNEAPAHLQAPYGAMLLSMLMVRDMPERQRDVWKGMFDHFVFKANGDPGSHLGPEDLGAMASLTPAHHNGALDTVLQGLLRHVQWLKRGSLRG
jgi:hypothetical protein